MCVHFVNFVGFTVLSTCVFSTQQSCPFWGERNGLSVHGMSSPIYLYHVVLMTDGGFDTLVPYQPERMTDGGFWPGRTRPWKEKKLIFGRQYRVEEDQSSRTFPPQRPCHLSHLFNFLHLIHITNVSLLGWKKRVE